MGKSIKILHIVPELGYGGVEKVVRNYYECLDHKKYIFDYVTHGSVEDYHKEILSNGSKIFYFKTLGSIGYKNYKKQIKDNINMQQYDIIHIHTGHITGLYARIFKSCGAKKIISHAHLTKSPNPKHKIFMPLFRIMSILYSDTLVACGKDAGKFCFGKAKFQFIPNGVNFQLYNNISKNEIDIVKDALGIKKDDYVIGHVGRFSKQKNQIFLTEIIHKYLKKNSNTKFVLVGDGPDKKDIEKVVIDNQDSENVIFTGTRNDVAILMKTFDLFLLPSLFEGLPVVGIEAQAAGLPCVFSNTIDKSVALFSDNCSFLPIDKGADLWVSEVDRIRKDNAVLKEDIYEVLYTNGYEISATAHKLSLIYDKLIDEG